MSSKVQESVTECMRSTVVPIPIRLSAIEAFRNSPCNVETKHALLELLEDKSQDNEVRIAAYLAVMRCPCSPALRRIEALLAIEEFNQGRNPGVTITVSKITSRRSSPKWRLLLLDS